MKNPNHPKKGDTITVEPIRKIEDIKALKKLLSDRPRDLLLFTMGINNGLRIGDLLKLKVKDVQGVKAGDTVRVREQKTGKQNVLVINKATYKALDSYFKQRNPEPDEYLFHSQRKTFGYIQRMHYGVGFELLCKRFNHSSPAVTMRYLGIEDKEVNGMLM